LTRLERPDTGSIDFKGRDVLAAKGSALLGYRRAVQMVFQDPNGSLNPRMTVEQLVTEGMVIHRRSLSPSQRRQRAASMLSLVGLDPEDLTRRPASFSGGQRQRIAIARALAVEPELLVCDEPVSSLDVSVQAQILNLLADTTTKLGLAILFVAHDLAVIYHMCSYIYVLHNGRVVEQGTREEVFSRPSSAYTRQLLDAVPDPDPNSLANRALRSGSNDIEGES
jgi:ABC-type microcin C transport system duplicated ATPase subunit YejF